MCTSLFLPKNIHCFQESESGYVLEGYPTTAVQLQLLIEAKAFPDIVLAIKYCAYFICDL